MRKRMLPVSLFIGVCWCTPLIATQPRLWQVDWTIPEAVIQNFSGEKAKTHVIEISRYYREDATPGFHEAAVYIAETARQLGLQDVHIESFPVDGKMRHFNMQTRYAWAPRRAELWLVDPPKKLADFQEISTQLATWSASADVETEMIDIGAGTRLADYEGKDVKGKIVLTSSPPSTIQEEAVAKRGAVGVVSYWSPVSRQAFPDQVHWLNTANNYQPTKTFGFVLSRRQGLALKEQLSKGPVRVRAFVDADLGAGNLEVVTAVIPGRELPEEEIFLLAHICHFNPSSNDNASGCGLLLEIARLWQDLMANGILAPPRRTVRFLWVPENHGTVAYAEAHPEISARVKAAINLDMVGEDLDRCNSVFRVVRTPDSRPSFLNDVVEHFTGVVAAKDIFAPSGSRTRFRYSVDDYVGGSDHVWLNDAGVGVPSVLLMHWPDNFYHSSEDSPDKVDPSELKRVGLIAFASVRYLCAATGAEVERLAARVAAHGRIRLMQEVNRALTYVRDAQTAALARARLRSLVEREARAIASCAALDSTQCAVVEAVAASFRREESAALNRFLSRLPPAAAEPAFTEGGLVVRRNGRYLSSMWRNNLRDRLPPEESARAIAFLTSLPQGDFSAFELFNLFDGQRTLAEVADVVETETTAGYMFDEYFGNGSMEPPPPYRVAGVDRGRLVEFVRLAEEADLVTVTTIGSSKKSAAAMPHTFKLSK